MMEEVILAVDGGATKTLVTMRNREGTILFEGQGEGVNYQVSGTKRVNRVLFALLSDVKSVFPYTHINLAVFALAGIDTEQDQLVVQSIVKEVCDVTGVSVGKLIIENDAQATMLGATGGKPGALVIAGTGSIAYAHDAKGNIVRAGGWGHRAGDEGSGYWIGREVLRAIFRMEDGRGVCTSLKEEVLKGLRLDSVEELAGWLYGREYTVDRVAALAPILNKCAEAQDSVALRIVEEAVCELALLIGAVLRACKLESRACDVYLSGGVLVHSSLLVQKLEKRVKLAFPLCRLNTLMDPPIDSIVARGWCELDAELNGGLLSEFSRKPPLP